MGSHKLNSTWVLANLIKKIIWRNRYWVAVGKELRPNNGSRPEWEVSDGKPSLAQFVVKSFDPYIRFHGAII